MKKRLIMILLSLIFLISILAGCSDNFESQGKYSRLSDLKNVRVGIVTGTTFDQIAQKKLENPQLIYYNGFVDLIPALNGNKIDCFISDEPAVRYLVNENKDITYFDEKLQTENYGFVFAKNEAGEKLRDEFNKFFISYSEGDTLQKLSDYWFSTTVTQHKTLDYQSLPAINGTIKVCTDSQNPPFEFYEGENLVGYDLEIIYDFCKSTGYGMEVTDMKFDSMIPAVTSGKYNIASSSYTITEERMKSVNFSEPVYSGGPVVAIRASDFVGSSVNTKESSWFENIILSFEKTFIKDNRWKLFLSGIGVTLLIAICSLLFGTILGFGVYMWYRRGSRICEKITGFFSWFITGMPEVLLLLIFYYLIFGKANISGVWVSIIAFTLVISVNVFDMTKSGVNTVDKGQTEAALAMGYSPNAGFFKMIMPQALQNIMPNYKASVIALIKSTAVVGYVAVQDLTKISDIVRSRTYDSFFPLIVTAAIYFVIAWILILAVDRIQVNLIPIRNSRDTILKGIIIDEKEE